MNWKYAHHAVLAALLVAIAMPGGAETNRDSYEALFEQALASITWNTHEDWAFTEATSGNDGDFVGRYDPRLPEDQRWTLLSIDGRDPTDEESRQYAERKHGEHHDGDHEDDGDVDGMVDPGSLELVSVPAGADASNTDPSGGSNGAQKIKGTRIVDW